MSSSTLRNVTIAYFPRAYDEAKAVVCGTKKLLPHFFQEDVSGVQFVLIEL